MALTALIRGGGAMHGMEKQREAVARRGGERLAKLSKGTAKQGDAKRRHSMG